MVIGYAILCWVLSLAAFVAGWRLRGTLSAPVSPVVAPVVSSPVVVPEAVQREERRLLERREAVLTQHLQGLASRDGRVLSPLEAAEEARLLLTQL